MTNQQVKTETDSLKTNSKLKRFVEYYKMVAILLLNTISLFLIINFILFIFFNIKDGFITETNPVSIKYRKPLEGLYSELNEKEVNVLQNETLVRFYEYEPFTQFKDRPYSGQYVNVDKNGFRVSLDQGPWPMSSKYINVFLFGGSTTFNFGVSDDKTIASNLQEFLSKNNLVKDVKVYNFGRGYYYSTQERILFEKLLVSGHVPDIAIFIDGLNEFFHFQDKPFFTPFLEAFMNGDYGHNENASYGYLDKLPVTRAAMFIQKAFISKNDDRTVLDEQLALHTNEKATDKETRSKDVINRYLKNKKLIEAASVAYSVNPIFVWQPIPLYKYDLKYHMFTEGGFGPHIHSKFGYAQMEKYINTGPMGNNFLWCADIQEGIRKALYVDKVHYSEQFSRTIARTICDILCKRNLFKRKNGSSPD